MADLFFLLGRGTLPTGDRFRYDPADPLGRLRRALDDCDELDRPLPPPADSWRGCWLEAFGRHWLDDAGQRRLLLAGLESAVLASLRAPSAVNRTRARALLRSLGPPATTDGRDEFFRWLPADGDGEWFDQALRLTARAASGPSYDVLFPGTWGDAAGLARARLTRLDGGPALGPRVVLAAWSDYLLAPDDAGRLAAQLDDAFARHPRHLGGRFLLELSRLDGLSPPAVAVEGQSLGLAVLLAAWAARREPALSPLIATGQLLAGEVRGVHRVYEKSSAVRDFLARGEPHRFLVPQENVGEVRGDLLARFAGRVEPVAPEVEELFARGDLLGDGCEGYRAALGRGEPWPDVAAVALPFGDDPAQAARRLLRADGEVVLPVCLGEGEGGLASRVRRGLRQLVGAAGDAVPVENLLTAFAGRVSLVAYARPSTDLVPHADDARRYAEVLAQAAALGRPRVLLVASDAHHLARLAGGGDRG